VRVRVRVRARVRVRVRFGRDRATPLVDMREVPSSS